MLHNLANTGAMQGTSRDKIYQELGLKSLKSRIWYKRLICMLKIMKKKAQNYLMNLIPKCNFRTYNCLTDCSRHYFFPSTLNGLFQLDINKRNSDWISLFKSRLLSFIRPNQGNMYNILDPIGFKLLTRLPLGRSHLNEQKLCNNFQDCLNRLCYCSLEIEDTTSCFANTLQTIATILWIV